MERGGNRIDAAQRSGAIAQSRPLQNNRPKQVQMLSTI
jgi:hypothetical protein